MSFRQTHPETFLAKTVTACRERLALGYCRPVAERYGSVPGWTRLEGPARAERRAAQDLRRPAGAFTSLNLPEG